MRISISIRMLATLAILPSSMSMASPVQEVLLLTANEGDDPLAVRQWALTFSRFHEAWDLAPFRGVPVAVIDGGVAVTHPDLLDVIVSRNNVVNGSEDVKDDCDGHGTAVTAALAAQRGNGEGIAGAIPVDVFAYKAFSPDSSGNCSATWAQVATAVRAAVADGARVITMSFGGRFAHPTMVAALQEAVSQDVSLIAAAGNYGPCEDCILFPASFPGVIAVGCVQPDGIVCPFSASGPTLDVVAPGLDILTAAPTGYVTRSGTSLSAPYVAGAVSLIRAQNPYLSQESIHRYFAIDAAGKPLDVKSALDDTRWNVAILALSLHRDLASLEANFKIANEGGVGREVQYRITLESSSGLATIEQRNLYLSAGEAADLCAAWAGILPTNAYRVAVSVAPGPQEGIRSDNIVEASTPVAFTMGNPEIVISSGC